MKIINNEMLSRIPISQLRKFEDIIGNAGEIRFVGGCVRDILCYKSKIEDFDLATNLLPHDLLTILHQACISASILSGKHGTVIANIDNMNFEITTLRKDLHCDGRHAEVEFINNWEVDAARRDFTINAMSMDSSYALYDYFGGLNDLKNGVVKFVGNPTLRITEDYLRILRYFRFCASFGLNNLDYDSFNAASSLSSNLAMISGERIRSEFFKMLHAKYAIDVLYMMYENQVNKAILLPDIHISQLKKLNFSKSNIANIVALLSISKDSQFDILELINKWNFSENEKKNIISLYEYYLLHGDLLHCDDMILHKKYAYILGSELYYHTLSLMSVFFHSFDPYGLYELVTNEIRILKLPINGNDLINLGLSGKQIGEALKLIEKNWIESNFQYSKSELLKIYNSYEL